MSCRYFYGVHPFMKIAPVKEEEVFLEPRLVLYHDVITDNELDVVKKLATPRVSVQKRCTNIWRFQIPLMIITASCSIQYTTTF